MRRRRKATIIFALLALLLLFAVLPPVLRRTARVPGLADRERTLLRIWVTSSPGGAQAWLTSQLREWEKQNPSVMTYLRSVTPDELLSAGAVLPDIVLFMPGDFTDPSGVLTPVADPGGLREELLRSGVWRGSQYGLPLCWGGYVLAIDGALEPGSAATPAPTTLLGKPAATAAPSTAPPYPLEAASAASCPLQCPGGAALFSLCALWEADERPPLPENFAQLTPAEVYAAFRSRACATAVLTTGQATAFSALTSAGKGFPFRIMVPDQIVTDQVWLAGVTQEASPAAEVLLRFLTSVPAQSALASQGLHTVRDDLRLYSVDFSAETEAASHRQLSVINAFLPAGDVHGAAWQTFQGSVSITSALPPLL